MIELFYLDIICVLCDFALTIFPTCLTIKIKLQSNFCIYYKSVNDTTFEKLVLHYSESRAMHKCLNVLINHSIHIPALYVYPVLFINLHLVVKIK